MKHLLKSGAVSAGDKLVWSRRVLKSAHEAVINQDGTISTSDGKSHKSPSGAAKHLNGNKPVDGWLAWKVKNTGDSLASLRNSK
jgi:hypothetical protein